MKHISRLILVCSFLVMNLLGMSFAGDQLDKATLEKLIKGNTVEGKFIKWKATYKMYFDPSGRFGRVDSLKNTGGGEWRVESDGTLRMIARKKRSRTVKQRSDGGYNVYDRRGQVAWTIDKVSPGNPYNLKARY